MRVRLTQAIFHSPQAILLLLLTTYAAARNSVSLSRSSDGLYELRLTYKGHSYLETSLAPEVSRDRLLLVQATDQFRLVELVVRFGTVDDCLVSTHPPVIRKFLSEFSDTLPAKIITSEEELADLYWGHTMTRSSSSEKTAWKNTTSAKESSSAEESDHATQRFHHADNSSTSLHLSAFLSSDNSSLFIHRLKPYLNIRKNTRQCLYFLEQAAQRLQALSMLVNKPDKGLSAQRQVTPRHHRIRSHRKKALTCRHHRNRSHRKKALTGRQLPMWSRGSKEVIISDTDNLVYDHHPLVDLNSNSQIDPNRNIEHLTSHALGFLKGIKHDHNLDFSNTFASIHSTSTQFSPARSESSPSTPLISSTLLNSSPFSSSTFSSSHPSSLSSSDRDPTFVNVSSPTGQSPVTSSGLREDRQLPKVTNKTDDHPSMLNQTETPRMRDRRHSNKERNKRDLLTGWMIFPGTKWCGDGDVAEHKKDVGYHVELDKCCRRHDLCPLIIPRLSWKFGMFNYRLHTISHCRCDRKFRKCLKTASSPLARLIGQIYFNVVGPQCFKFSQKSTCSERYWWGGCKDWTESKVAYLKQQRRFK